MISISEAPKEMARISAHSLLTFARWSVTGLHVAFDNNADSACFRIREMILILYKKQQVDSCCDAVFHTAKKSQTKRKQTRKHRKSGGLRSPAT
jgi:hypothetical protein